MPAPAHGFQAMAMGLTHETHLEAFKIVKDKECYSEFLLSDDMMGRVNEVKSQCSDETHLFAKLSASICPEIFGMEEIKQALLLLMIGGVTNV